MGTACAAPPEDSGGAWGYQDKLEVLADPDDEEHEQIKAWLGEEFDAEAFDVERINGRLRQTFQRTRRRSARSG